MAGRFAAPHNAISSRFNALFDAPDVGAFEEDWSGGWCYLTPPSTKIGAELDKPERDNAAAVLAVPVWKSRGWWRRLASRAWTDRFEARHNLPPTALATVSASSDRPSIPRSSRAPSDPTRRGAFHAIAEMRELCGRTGFVLPHIPSRGVVDTSRSMGLDKYVRHLRHALTELGDDLAAACTFTGQSPRAGTATAAARAGARPEMTANAAGVKSTDWLLTYNRALGL